MEATTNANVSIDGVDESGDWTLSNLERGREVFDKHVAEDRARASGHQVL